MLAYNSQGQLVNVAGDQWSTGYLPPGYYASPYQWAVGNGLATDPASYAAAVAGGRVPGVNPNNSFANPVSPQTGQPINPVPQANPYAPPVASPGPVPAPAPIQVPSAPAPLPPAAAQQEPGMAPSVVPDRKALLDAWKQTSGTTGQSFLTFLSAQGLGMDPAGNIINAARTPTQQPATGNTPPRAASTAAADSAAGAAPITLYNLEGQPVGEIAPGQPIPDGRWTTPTGGQLWQSGRGPDQKGTIAGATPPTAPQPPAGPSVTVGPGYNANVAGGNPPTPNTGVANPVATGGLNWVDANNNPTTPPTNVGNMGPFAPSAGTGAGAGIGSSTGTDTGTGAGVGGGTSDLGGGGSGGTGGGAGYNPSGVNSDPTAHYRDIYGEGGATLAALAQFAPDIYAQYARFAPQYAQTDYDTLAYTMFGPNFNPGDSQWGGTVGLNDILTRAAAQQTTNANRELREANLADAIHFSGEGGYGDVYKTRNQELFNLLGAVDQKAEAGVPFNQYQNTLGAQFNQGNPYLSVNAPTLNAQQVNAPTMAGPGNVQAQTVGAPGAAREIRSMSVGAPMGDMGLFTAQSRLGLTGPSDIQSKLESQARGDLALGRSLSQEDIRTAQQAAREAWAARGLVGSKGAVAEEVLNRDSLARARERERQAFAQGVDQTGFAQRQQGVQTAIGVSDAARGYGALGVQAGMANQGANLSAQQANQGRDITLGQFGLQAGLSNQDAALRASLANQQMGYNVGSQNQQAQLQALLANQGADLQAQQATAGFGLDAQRSNQAMQQQARAQNQTLGLNLSNIEQNQYQQGFQNLLSATNARQATAFDPFSLTFGQSSTNAGQNQNLFSQGGMTSSGQLGNQNVQNYFNPLNAYASDLYSTNYNAVEAARLGAANNSTGKKVGWMNMAGSIIGGLLGGGR